MKSKAKHFKNHKKQKYPLILLEIVEKADIILEILDARFPEKTRNLEIEKKIIKLRKKLIYILNKADLIKTKRLKKYNYLSPNVAVSCKRRKGIRKVRGVIEKISKEIFKSKKIKENQKFEKKIIVGVIGYPNTGKSSLINALVGKKLAPASSEAGYTKGVQKIRLSKNIVIIDTPGVIPKQEYSTTEKEKRARQAMLGGRSYSQVKEPELVVAKIMKEYPKILEKFYKIEARGDSEILLQKLGKKKGFIKKGGEVNEDKTARFILKEWQEGRIKF